MEPFSRSLLYTFTYGENFLLLTITSGTLGYRYAITEWIPRLDSLPSGYSNQPLNVLMATFLRSLFPFFKLGQIFELLTIPPGILIYRPPIAKRILLLDSPN